MTKVVRVRGMLWPQKGATHYHAKMGLPDKGCAMKGLVVCNNWDLEPLDRPANQSGPRLLSTVP